MPWRIMWCRGNWAAELRWRTWWPAAALVIGSRATACRQMITLDPLSAMAQPDQDALLALLQQTEFESQAVKDMLEALANGEIRPLLPLTEACCSVRETGPHLCGLGN